DAGGGDHLPRPVAGEAALVVVAPGVGDAGLGVEVPAVVEDVAEGAARPGGGAEPGQDPLARPEFGGQLRVGRLEVDEPRQGGVEPAPLGADDDEGPGPERRAGGNGVAVAREPGR